MKRTLTILGLIVSCACIGFFLKSLALHWNEIAKLSLERGVWIHIAFAFVIYMTTYIVVSYAWGRSLKALGHPLPFVGTVRILVISQFAKYLPGNVGHHVGRVVLAKRAGLPVEVIVGSMILDTLIVLAAAGLCSFPALRLALSVARTHGAAFSRALTFFLLAGLILLLAISLIPFTQRFLRKQIRLIPHLTQARNLVSLSKALAAHVISVLAGGSALYLLCLAFSQLHSSGNWLGVTGVYAVAWMLGFLIPGAPAGLGIRELVLLLGLSPLFGDNAATVAAATLRMVTTLGDGCAFALGFMLHDADAANTASQGNV